MTYGQYIQHALSRLENLYTKSESRVLLQRIFAKIGLKPLHIYELINHEKTVEVEEELNSFLERLLNSEPIQYIEEEVDFQNLRLNVTKDVLIPRPETEELVEWIKVDYRSPPESILDIGTGSGCIALSLKSHWPESRVTAVDISEKALQVALENATRNNIDLNLVKSDILNELLPQENLSIIVSNPPYVLVSEKKQMDPNVLNYEPHLALFVEREDAIIFYKKIIDLAHTRLTDNGAVYFETNPLNIDEVSEYAKGYNFNSMKKRDAFDKERFLKLFRN